MSLGTSDIDRILSAAVARYRGPGGVLAVVKDGQLVGQRAWGYADLERRIPMTTRTMFPICSISKQMVCLAMESLRREPTPAMLERKIDPSEQFEAEMRKLLPQITGAEASKQLRVADLYNMQSGIRDYWAMTTLWGSQPDGPFSYLHDAPQSLAYVKSFHFEPGTEYSYSNVNFYVLGRILEEVSGISLGQILSTRLFIPAGMTTAALCPNTNGLPLPIVGYEGNEKVGYFRATNRIEWAGDAGIAASLEDMIAYEKYLNRSLDDSQSLYAQTSRPQKFRDSTPAAYGQGLARFEIADREAIGHGGALRGFRHQRVQIPSERISVVAFHNWEPDPGSVAEFVVKQILGWEDPKETVFSPANEIKGTFLDRETQLCLTIKDGDRAKPGTISFEYGPGTGGESATLKSETHAESPGMKLTVEGDVLTVERLKENRTLRADRIKPSEVTSHDYIGVYRCGESESTLHVTGDGSALYGSFEGFLGHGPIWIMKYIGQDVWLLGNPRGLDSTPPGDWTIVFKRAESGKVQGCTVGCWLARKLEYSRQ